MDELATWQCPPDSCVLGLPFTSQGPAGYLDSGVSNTEAAADSSRENEITERENEGGMPSLSVWVL